MPPAEIAAAIPPTATAKIPWDAPPAAPCSETVPQNEYPEFPPALDPFGTAWKCDGKFLRSPGKYHQPPRLRSLPAAKSFQTRPIAQRSRSARFHRLPSRRAHPPRGCVRRRNPEWRCVRWPEFLPRRQATPSPRAGPPFQSLRRELKFPRRGFLLFE